MNSKLSGGPIGLLVGVAAAIALAAGAATYVVQARDNANSVASVTLRTHDEVVSWPNHTALQREAVAAVNSPDGQSQIVDRTQDSSSLVSVEATSLGDPATVEIVATATNPETALAAAGAASDLAIAGAIEDREIPLRSQIEVLRTDLDQAVQERDGFLSDLANGVDDDGQRAITSASAESAAGVASVLEIDLARLEADLAAKAAPFVAIDDPRIVSENRNDLRSALAGALGIFFLSLLGLSMSKSRPDATNGQGQTIDLTDKAVRRTTTVAKQGSSVSGVDEQAPVG